jgi:hypothetical protein
MSSPEPSGSAMRLWPPSIQTNLESLIIYQLGDDLLLSTVDRSRSPEPAHQQRTGPRCSLEVSLPLQGRPCGRPPAAAVLGRQTHQVPAIRF